MKTINEMLNDLILDINQFKLREKNRPLNQNIEYLTSYYHNIVDEYNMYHNMLLTMLETDNIEMQDLINDQKHILDSTFEKYKSEIIIQSYLTYLDSQEINNVFYHKLYKFEKSLVISPLELLDDDIIIELVNSAKILSGPDFYYYTHNPFNIDNEYGISIPEKKSFETSDQLVTSVYNYITELFKYYKDINSDEIDKLNITKLIIEEYLLELKHILNYQMKHKIYPSKSTTSIDYYNDVKSIEFLFDTHKKKIMLDIHKYHDILKDYTTTVHQIDSLLSEYKSHTLFKQQERIQQFNALLETFHGLLRIIEDGKLDIYVYDALDNINLKSIVNSLIDMSKEMKMDITYIETYNETGTPIKRVFKYYQMDYFLESIKLYYYRLQTENIRLQNNITIDMYGNPTIDIYRNTFKKDLAQYTQFKNQNITYFNEFELDEYKNQLDTLQTTLKLSMEIFFDAAIKTSPLTYISNIENKYKNYLVQLENDLLEINTQKKYNKVIDPEILTIIQTIENYKHRLDDMIITNNKLCVLGFTSIIKNKLYHMLTDIYIKIVDAFNADNYDLVIELYKSFLDTNIVDFNMFTNLDILTTKVEDFSNMVSNVDTIFIDSQLTSIAPKDNELLDFFKDENFKNIRNDIFKFMDTLYTFLISITPNDEPFLINEKNLKKQYIDNQIIKINCINNYFVLLKSSVCPEKFRDITDLESDFNYLLDFNYLTTIDTIILQQNKILSTLHKMIVEYHSDTNTTIDIVDNIMDVIDIQNTEFNKQYETYNAVISRLDTYLKYNNLVKEENKLYLMVTNEWNEIIHNNNIPEPKQMSYNDLEVIKGNIPFKVEFNAKEDDSISDPNNTPEFVWTIGTTVLEGKNVSYTFFNEGKHKVRCDMKTSDGEIATRFIEFELDGPTNSQIVKSEVLNYTPLTNIISQPKLTYFDSELGKQITIPINVNGNVLDMVSDGVINVSESDEELKKELIGLVILGFDGIGFAGSMYDNTQISGDEFEMPEEAEFLFDFQISNPIINRSIIDITNSRFIDYIAKIPKSLYQSVYEIEDANNIPFNISTKLLSIIPTDLILMKNKNGRFCIVSIEEINENTETDTYNFNIKFKFHVNISLNKFEKHIFEPQSTNYVVPTLMFAINSTEIFGSMISILEQIDNLKSSMLLSNDNEEIIMIKSEIEKLEKDNQKNRIFCELEHIYAMSMKYKRLLYNFDNPNNINDIDTLKKNISTTSVEISNVKFFSDMVNEINIYDFRNNKINLRVLVALYDELLKTYKIYISTFNFKTNNINYYIDKINELSYLPEVISQTDYMVSPNYIEQLKLVVLNMRKYMYMLKLIINFPIITEKNILMSEPYNNNYKTNGRIIETNDTDFYLLYKKLELKYGKYAPKVENGNLSVNFINDLINITKDTFGNKMSSDELSSLGKYIQTVEENSIEEYDNFFMFPLWLDYLEKNK